MDSETGKLLVSISTALIYLLVTVNVLYLLRVSIFAVRYAYRIYKRTRALKLLKAAQARQKEHRLIADANEARTTGFVLQNVGDTSSLAKENNAKLLIAVNEEDSEVYSDERASMLKNPTQVNQILLNPPGLASEEIKVANQDQVSDPHAVIRQSFGNGGAGL